MSKTYIYCLVIIGVYLIVISPLNTDKKEEKKEDSKEEKKEDNSNSNEEGTNKTPLQRRFPNFNEQSYTTSSNVNAYTV